MLLFNGGYHLVSMWTVCALLENWCSEFYMNKSTKQGWKWNRREKYDLICHCKWKIEVLFQPINLHFRYMMLDTILFLLIGVLQTRGALEPPTQCPHWCACDTSAVLCNGGGIPQMEPKTKTFNLNNANPPILELSPTITKYLQHMVGHKTIPKSFLRH